jgi:deglycase
MGNGSLQGLRIAILVTDGFEQVELEKPRAALDDAGADTIVVSPNKRTVQGMKHIDEGAEFIVDQQMEHAEPDDFDAVLLPGGVVNADTLRMNEDARRFVQGCDANGKPIAVICHGPWLLVSAGLVKGRHLTSYYTVQDDIRNAGGSWTDQKTVLDENWISSRQPDDIPAFNKTRLELFAGIQKKSKRAGQA